jgi:glycerol kinase
MLLAIDVGTSSTRAIVYNKSGSVISEAHLPLQTFYPHNGWVEQCPEEIWTKTLEVFSQAIEKSGTPAKKIKACGITNQRETTIVWHAKTGKVLAPAIVWQDRRTSSLCKQMRECKELIHQKTGLILDPYFSASKLLWLKQNNHTVLDAMSKGHCLFGTVDTFILWRLTRGQAHRTEASNASRTMLVNLQSGQWDTDLLNLFGIPESVLPEICDSNAHFGEIDSSFVGSAIPITGILGDQQAATVGQCCFSKGEGKTTFGTGCFSMLNTGNEPVSSSHQLLSTILYQLNGKRTYALEGSLFNAGTSIKWLRDELGLIENAEQSEAFAKALEDNQGVFFIPAFTGLGAPFWQPSMRASFVGLQLASDKKVMVRAVLESICYQVRALMEAKKKDFNGSFIKLKVDGGMTVNNWLMQTLANCLSMKVARRSVSDVTAWGVAMLASFGANEISNLEAIRSFQLEEQHFQPEKEGLEEENYQKWLNIVERMISLNL